MAETQLQATTGQPHRPVEPTVLRAPRADAPPRGSRTWLSRWPTSTTSSCSTTRYGHETGDRALRVFAQVLRESMRSQDWCAATAERSSPSRSPAAAGRRARSSRRHAADSKRPMTVAGLPKFTVSFGVVDARPERRLPELSSAGPTPPCSRPSERGGTGGRGHALGHDPGACRIDRRAEQRQREGANGWDSLEVADTVGS